MRFVDHSILAIAYLSTISFGKPLLRRDGFTVQQTISKSSSAANGGPAELAQVYRKYHSKVPARLRKAAQVAVENAASVVANPSTGDAEYTSVVTIGGQDVNLDFDTGSSDL